jgi:hypothetical protein
LGHAPLPADCQDTEQFEFESHVDRDRREEEEKLNEKDSENFR